MIPRSMSAGNLPLKMVLLKYLEDVVDITQGPYGCYDHNCGGNSSCIYCVISMLHWRIQKDVIDYSIDNWDVARDFKTGDLICPKLPE